MTKIIDRPGIYDLTEEEYHGDQLVPGGSLSCSGAKLLTPPGCPALFDWVRRQPRQATKAMELGTAAHREVLGVGWEYKVGEWENYRTKAAQDWAKECRDNGVVPLLPSEHEQIQGMAAAVRAHPAASVLLGGEALPEMSAFWQDDDTGVWLRARFDAIRLPGRIVIADLKTAKSADPWEFARSAANYRYNWQAVWYQEAITHTLGDADPLFVFVVQERDPPYLITVCDLPMVAIEKAMDEIRQARRVYARCVASGEWPGYQPGEWVTTLDWPRWAS